MKQFVILQHLLRKSNRCFYPGLMFSASTAEKEAFVSVGLLLFSKRSGFSILTEVEPGWQCAETGHHSGGRWRKCNTPGLAAAPAAAAAPCAQNIACQYCPHWPIRIDAHTRVYTDTWACSPRCLLICSVLMHTHWEAEGCCSIHHSSSIPHGSLSKLHFFWWWDLSCWWRDRNQKDLHKMSLRARPHCVKNKCSCLGLVCHE